MAAPHVAGAVALVRGLAPELTVLETKDLILSTVDPLPWFQGVVESGGRLNIATALEHVFTSQVAGVVWSDDRTNLVQDADEVDLPEPASGDVLPGGYIVRRAAVLGSHLDDPIVPARGPDHLLSFPRIVADRLLYKHVFAGLAPPHGGQGVPMNGQGEH